MMARRRLHFRSTREASRVRRAHSQDVGRAIGGEAREEPRLSYNESTRLDARRARARPARKNNWQLPRRTELRS